MRVFLSILSLLIPFSINAYTPNLTCPGEITLEAEWIYFAPTSETSYYAIVSSAMGINGERRANLFDDFHSGYRLSAAYTFCHCDRFLSLTWTRLRARHNDEIVVNTLSEKILAVLGPPDFIGGNAGQASDNKTFSYNALDVIAGQPFFSFSSTNVIGFVGVHYAHLFTKENYFFFYSPTDIAFGNLGNSFWGVGPELGITIAGKLGCGFSLQGSATGAMLIGRQKSSYFIERGDFLDVPNQPSWQVVPYSNIRVGLQYLFDSLFCECAFQCFTGTIEIGYEVPVYFNALSNIVFVDSIAEGVSIDYRRNVTMHGPYLSLALRF